MGQIIPGPGFSRIKCKLQHLHVRISGLLYQLTHRWRDKPKILSDDLLSSKGRLNGIEQLTAGPLAPLAEFCRGISVRDGIILIKTAEMIDADYIIHPETVGHPGDPPGVAGLFMVLPTIDRIAPQLPGGRKAIGRTAGYDGRKSLLIKLKKLRVTPGIGGVKSHIDRYISNDLNSLFIGICLQVMPLTRKQELLKLIKPDLIRQLFFGLFHGLFSAQPDILRPFNVTASTVLIFDSGIQRIIYKPVLIRRNKIGKFPPLLIKRPAGPFPGGKKSKGTVFIRPL